MKKKMGFVLILFIFLLNLPNIVYADNFTVDLKGADSASTNEKIDFTIALKTEMEAVEFSTNLKYDTNILELVSIIKKDNWSGNNTIKNSGSDNLVFTNNGTTGEVNIVTLRFNVKSSDKSNTTIALDSIKLTVNSKEGEDESNIVLSHNEIKKDVAIKSDDNTLKSIKIDGKPVNGFNASVYDYAMEVDALVDSIELNCVLSNASSSVFENGYGNRKVSLDYGKNEVLIKIKSESGKIAVYTLNIVRKDDRLINNDLKSIIIEGGKVKIDFDKKVLSYTIKTYKLDKIDIQATADDSTSKVKVDVPSKLVIGDNKVRITVTAVNGDIKEYNLLIVNSEVPTDTRLKNLSVKNENIGFSSDKYKYVIRYDKSYKDGLTIYKTGLSNDVEIEVVGNNNLKEGSIVKVVVNALDGSSSSEYTITLEKDSRISFFLILDVVIAIVLIILIIIQLNKRKKKREVTNKKNVELEKTKEIKL